MHLKALEIQGFKSFPDKVRLTFEKNITAIVGPNGSGKSNISDAIAWVMGEQRTKALRGGKMEDVIFGGTEKRSALGFAQVTLILDNAAHVFPIDSGEVMITRRYYRSGESEYYINRESVRLKDINELLMDTGLGREGYSIIGQGRISEIVSAKSTDRREIFEEAAGISRYRHRKEESERKLQRTEENLLRIHDKIDELELQVTPLKEQAETAKKYLTLRDALRELEISVWMDTLDRLRAQAETVNAEYTQAKTNLDTAHEELSALYAQGENLTEKMREKDVEVENLRALLREAEVGTAECESAAAVLRTNIQNHFERIDRIRMELSEQEDYVRGLDSQIAERRARVAEIDAQRADITAATAALQGEMEALAEGTGEARQALQALLAQENALNERLSAGRTMLGMLADSAQDLLDRETTAGREQTAQEEKLAGVEATLRADRTALAEAREKNQEIENTIAGHQMLMSGREEKVRALQERRNTLTVDLNSMTARINMLSEMEKEYEGYNKSVRTVMREAQRGALRGVRGPVANLVKAEDRYALAIETALGAAMQNIVVEDSQCGKAAIELLKRRDAGRATFLPLSEIRGSALRRVPEGEAGFLGVAVDLVRYDSAYAGIFQSLLGRTVVTETLGDAIRIGKKYGSSFRLVSLDGQVVNAGGSLTGGSSARGTGMLSRANERKRLSAQRETCQADFERCCAELEAAQRERDAGKYALEVAQTEHTQSLERLHRCEAAVAQSDLLRSALEENLESLEREKGELARKIRENDARLTAVRAETAQGEAQLAELQKEIQGMTAGQAAFEAQRLSLSEQLSERHTADAALLAEREATLRAAAQMDSMRREYSQSSGERQASIGEIEARIEALKAELTEKEARILERGRQVEEIQTRISDIAAFKLELEGQRTRAEKAGQEKNKELLDMERLCARYEQKKLAADLEEKQLLDKLWDSYGLSHSAAEQVRQQVENPTKANRRILELRREMNALGNPNLGAIEEYERVRTRYDFLTEQRDDVLKSKRELTGIIRDITGEMEEIFVREFKAIDALFRKTFLALFGGGKASLVLEDEENVLECGIEIQVQPPGKAVSTISLLSGGEKAFVAIALYFAILQVRPTPFCVMDEIEAALDEANVIRYAEYMRSLADKTQFIVITHRRGTMEEADMLYGVTMQEKGVSRVISVDLAEAEKTIA